MSSTPHVPPSRPLRFDSYDPEWDLGQSTRHFKLCVYLWEMLRRAAGRASTVGCDNFVYFDAEDSDRKCAPDAFVRVGVREHQFSSWKTWEDGTPELCVEILSPAESQEKQTAPQKLAAFQTMGVREVVFFDVEAPEGSRLRAWDRIDGKLVPRAIVNERTPCKTLGHWFQVGGPLGEEPLALLLTTDEAGRNRVLIDADARVLFEAKWVAEAAARREAEAARRDAEEARREAEDARRAAEATARAEAQARRAAELRVHELEELLRSKG